MRAVVIERGEYGRAAELLDQMFRLRARVFDGRLAWEVAVEEGREVDGYDDVGPTYVLAVDARGTVVGSVRLLPALGPNMLAHTFPQLLATGHALGQEVDIDRPVVSGELPIGGHRFEGLLPPVVAAPTFSIRRRASRLIPLSAYVASGAMNEAQHEALTQAIADRRNIVVAGGTGSGKTTLTNAVIAEMVRVAPEHRLVILEDTAEIRCEAENAVSLRTSDTVDMGLLLKSTLRLRPDRIIVGEVRDGAALTLLKAWNTGHPGGITTVHANDAAAALVRLEQLTAEVSPRPMREVIGEAVDLVVGIERTASGRRIRELLEVEGHADGRWITRPIATEDRSHVA